MAVMLNQLLLRIQSKYELTCITGTTGMTLNVNWVYYMEDVSTLDFIRGGEIVITTGMHCREEKWILDLIEQAVKYKATAVIINVGQYIKGVSEEAIAFAKQKGIPVFVMPWKMHIVDLTQDICNFILLEKQKEFDVKKVFSSFFFKDTCFDEQLLAEHGISGKEKYCILKGEMKQERKTGRKNLPEEKREKEQQLERIIADCIGELCQWNVPVCEEECIFVYLELKDISKNNEETIKSIKQKLERKGCQHEIQWGIGNIKTTFAEIEDAKEEAKKAFFVGIMQEKKVVTYAESGVYRILLEVENQKVLKEIYREKLGVLEDFPEEEKNMYLETLRNYIECNGSIQKIAERSYVHRNTVNYRMKKLKEILPVSLEDEQEKFMIWLSFFIADIIEGRKKLT